MAGREKLWTPANVVTLVRICLVPVFVVALITPWPAWLGLPIVTDEVKSLIAGGIFILISCTDWLDGYLARSRNEVTDFGKFVDPLADKILVAAALLALVELSVLPAWPVLIILAREFIVSGIRMIAASKGVVIAASWYGKAKTVTQIVAIVLFILKGSVPPTTPLMAVQNVLYMLSWLVMLIALVLTVVSMLDYLSKARHLLGLSSSGPALPARVGVDEDTEALAARVIRRAEERGLTVATAESLTGGLIAGALTAVPGSSAVVRGGVVSYVNDVKERSLGVSRDDLRSEGAVSEPVARQMAAGVRERLGADLAVAVTGIAGPGGAEPGKPVGTVWMAVASAAGVEAKLCHFTGDRSSVRAQTVRTALEMLLDSAESLSDGAAPRA